MEKQEAKQKTKLNRRRNYTEDKTKQKKMKLIR